MAGVCKKKPDGIATRQVRLGKINYSIILKKIEEILLMSVPYQPIEGIA